MEVALKIVEVFFFVIFQLVIRLGILVMALFLAACLGLCDYWLINVGNFLLHETHLGFKWEAVRVLELCLWGMVVTLLAGCSIGIFGGGVGCAIEGP